MSDHDRAIILVACLAMSVTTYAIDVRIEHLHLGPSIIAVRPVSHADSGPVLASRTPAARTP
jgi:hypothetical protein